MLLLWTVGHGGGRQLEAPLLAGAPCTSLAEASRWVERSASRSPMSTAGLQDVDLMASAAAHQIVAADAPPISKVLRRECRGLKLTYLTYDRLFTAAFSYFNADDVYCAVFNVEPRTEASVLETRSAVEVKKHMRAELEGLLCEFGVQVPRPRWRALPSAVPMARMLIPCGWRFAVMGVGRLQGHPAEGAPDLQAPRDDSPAGPAADGRAGLPAGVETQREHQLEPVRTLQLPPRLIIVQPDSWGIAGLFRSIFNTTPPQPQSVSVLITQEMNSSFSPAAGGGGGCGVGGGGDGGSGGQEDEDENWPQSTDTPSVEAALAHRRLSFGRSKQPDSKPTAIPAVALPATAAAALPALGMVLEALQGMVAELQTRLAVQARDPPWPRDRVYGWSECSWTHWESWVFQEHVQRDMEGRTAALQQDATAAKQQADSSSAEVAGDGQFCEFAAPAFAKGFQYGRVSAD